MATGNADNTQAEGELRQLTVVVCDMVDSTSIAEKLDIEDYHNLMVSFRKACSDIVPRYGGYVAREVGDGLQIYFGYPKAQENDARRAVQAALEMTDAVSRLKIPGGRGDASANLAVRVGVHTGMVVAADARAGLAPDTPRAEGITLHIAERLQSLATPGRVVVSDATYRLVEGYVACGEIREVHLKGISQPVIVREVLGTVSGRRRQDNRPEFVLPPLVGRNWQLALLHEYWERSKTENGQIVLIQGEPGIGKTRLLQALHDDLARESDRWFECHCLSLATGSALYPFVELFEALFETELIDDSSDKLARIEARLNDWGLQAEKLLPAFSTLMSLPAKGHDLGHSENPKRVKREIFEAMMAWFLAESQNGPLVLVVEDLHWADASTLEFLVALLEQVPLSQAYVILTFRPEFEAPWRSTARFTQLALDRLSRGQAEEVARHIAKRVNLSDETFEQIVTDTDGVPLYIEECTKAQLDTSQPQTLRTALAQGSGQHTLALPIILRESLTARLDRLGVAKEIAQLASAIGRSFTFQLVLAVWHGSDEDLISGLDTMVRAELLFPKGLPPDSSYMFKHALIQEQAYETLLASRRRAYHQKIAEALEHSFPDIKASRPELIAQHLVAAGRNQRAIEYWMMAGERALQRSAIVEAVAHYESGLHATAKIDDPSTRQKLEITLRLGLGAALIARDGWASANVEENLKNARMLCADDPNDENLFHVIRGLVNVSLLRGELAEADKYITQLSAVIGQLEPGEQRDSLFLTENHSRAVHNLFSGRFAESSQFFDRARQMYDSDRLRRFSHSLATDPLVIGNALGSWNCWFVGETKEACRRMNAALSRAAEQDHPFGAAYAECMAATLHLLRRDYSATLAHSKKAIAIAQEQGHSYWVAYAEMTRGAALVALESPRQGVATMTRGCEAYRKTGSRVLLPFFRTFLAAGYGEAGLPREGLEMLDRNEASEVGIHVAESARVRAELLAQIDPHSTEPEPHFRTALEIAARQGGQSLELRASVSLARWLGEHQSKAAAVEILRNAIAKFGGDDAEPDLLDAQSLLAELGE